MRNLIYCIIVYFALTTLNAQEIKGTVSIATDQLGTTGNNSYVDKAIINDMQSALLGFINNNKWTTQTFQTNEKINLTLQINLTEAISLTRFKATAQIIASRPVYGVSYETVCFSFIDKDWEFEYAQGQPIIYSENAYTNNLTSLLSFFVYMALGYDYDSFSKNGGSALLDKAFQISNNAQSANDRGWKSADGPNARYFLTENLQNPQLAPFREGMYKYHREGLDLMATDPETARKKILEVLESLQKMNQVKVSTLVMRNFFNSKDNELVGIFSQANGEQKQKVVDILRELDPTNSDKYQKIFKN